MIYAQKLAKKGKVPLCVCFCLVPTFLGATIRHYGFMLKGLQELEKVNINSGWSNVVSHNLIGVEKSADTILLVVWKC